MQRFFNLLINREAGCIVLILARPPGIWGASVAVEAFHMVCEFHNIPYPPRILAVQGSFGYTCDIVYGRPEDWWLREVLAVVGVGDLRLM